MGSLVVATPWLQELLRNRACSPLMLSTTYSTNSFVLANSGLVTIAKTLEALCNDCICQEGFHLMESVSKY